MMLGSLCAETIRPGQNLTAVEGNASVYQVNPVSRMSGEGRAEFSSACGLDFDQKGREGGEGTGGAGQLVRGNFKQFLWGRGEMWRGGRALGRIDVGICFTRGARSRRWWWYYAVTLFEVQT